MARGQKCVDGTLFPCRRRPVLCPVRLFCGSPTSEQIHRLQPCCLLLAVHCPIVPLSCSQLPGQRHEERASPVQTRDAGPPPCRAEPKSAAVCWRVLDVGSGSSQYSTVSLTCLLLSADLAFNLVRRQGALVYQMCRCRRPMRGL